MTLYELLSKHSIIRDANADEWGALELCNHLEEVEAQIPEECLGEFIGLDTPCHSVNGAVWTDDGKEVGLYIVE